LAKQQAIVAPAEVVPPAAAAAGDAGPPPAVRVVRLQAGGVETSCVGVAPGGRKRRQQQMLRAAQAAQLATEGAEVDCERYCKTVSLQCGGEQTVSYGLGPGERKGDFARARFMRGPRPG
jgi:hypothetical protein